MVDLLVDNLDDKLGDLLVDNSSGVHYLFDLIIFSLRLCGEIIILLTNWLRPSRRLETYETRTVFQCRLLVLLVTEDQRYLAGPDISDVVVYPHADLAREHHDDLLARVVVRLGAGPLGLGVVTDFQFLAGNGRPVSRGVPRRYGGFRHFLELEEWHKALQG